MAQDTDDSDSDPWGPTGSQTRRLRTDSGPRSWPLRGGPETADNARVEFARRQADLGRGEDIELPKDNAKPITKGRALRGGKR